MQQRDRLGSPAAGRLLPVRSDSLVGMERGSCFPRERRRTVAFPGPVRYVNVHAPGCRLGAFLRALDADEQPAAARAGLDQRLPRSTRRGPAHTGPVLAPISGWVSGDSRRPARPAPAMQDRHGAREPEHDQSEQARGANAASPQSMPSSPRTGAGCGGLTTVAASRSAS